MKQTTTSTLTTNWVHRAKRSLIACLAIGLLLPSLPANATEKPRTYIVVLNVSPDEAISTIARQALSGSFEFSTIYQHAIVGYSVDLSDAQVGALEKDPAVSLIAEDAPVYLTDQRLPTGVDRIEADRNSTANIDGTPDHVPAAVAIVDSGIAPHEDLNLARSLDCTRTKLTSPDWPCQDETLRSFFDHGTKVAGVAGAVDNRLGVVGVAPGADLYSLRVTDLAGEGSVSSIISAMEWITKNADLIDVANLSIVTVDPAGGTALGQVLRLAITRAVSRGVVVVAAAGNDKTNASKVPQDVYGSDGQFGGIDDIYPAAFPEVLTISAFEDDDGRPGGDSFASFSNYGKAVDLSLPGVNVETTSRYTASGYDMFTGTSAAAPHAAGLAALYIAVNGKPVDAAGVYRVHDGLIAAAQDQHGPNGLDLGGDPDEFPEPVGWAIGEVFGNTRPAATFSSACSDLSCAFADSSSDPDGSIERWSWDFGDGSTSDHQNPAHTYQAAGEYTVMLTVTDDEGAISSAAQTLSVTAPQESNEAPTADFSADCTNGSCTFIDLTTDPDGTVASWAWDFGDGGTSSLQHPSHSYADPGTYVVTLSVTDDQGAGSTITKTLELPQADISLATTSYRDRGGKGVHLVWDGTISSDVDVYRDGSLVATTSNDGSYVDLLEDRGRATYTYQICESGRHFCSNSSTIEL